VIYEPVQGVGGFILPPAGVLGVIHEVVRAHGGLSISDEVQTGWGRTGTSASVFMGFNPTCSRSQKGLRTAYRSAESWLGPR
jgi:4-aminobutyrate aminotransferase-like enzyme